MSKIAFTTASGFGPLPRLLKDMGGEAVVRRVFQAVGLSAEACENRAAHLPMGDMIALFWQAVADLGVSDFGLVVGEQMSPADFGPWARYVSAAKTLGEMLQRGRRALCYHQTGAEIWVEICGAAVRWSYAINCPFAANPQPFIDHVLQPMINFVRLYAGPRWRPIEIEVAYPGSARGARLSDKFQAPVHLNKRTTTLTIERELLSLPRLQGSADAGLVTYGDLRRMARSIPPRSTSDKISSVVRLLIPNGHAEIETVAKKLNVSVRTLQRELNRDGLRFRDVVQQARFEQAVRLVAETQLPLDDIATQMGYSDPSNFTRAFRNAAGMPPSAYRRFQCGVL
jgi:AraC-like DNA-binding protein